MSDRQHIDAENEALEQDPFKEVAYIVAHDLKGPSANLRSLVEFLEADPKLSSESKQIIEKMRTSLEQMEDLLSKLNEVILFHIDLKQENETIKLNEILQLVTEGIENQIKESKARLSIDFSACPSINYSQVHIKSILQNLLTNAIKFRKPGRKLEIKLSTGIEKGWCYLLVEDNGLGINLDEYGDELFKLLRRFQDNVEGSGMGLYIVQSIVRLYGGKIEVKSKIGKGTSFKVYLREV